MEDKGKMDELIEQMKLMNERLARMERHQRRIDFTSEYQARQQGYTGFIDEDIVKGARRAVYQCVWVCVPAQQL